VISLLTLPNDAGKTSSVDDGVHEDSKKMLNYFSVFLYSLNDFLFSYVKV
jgi:hypothetical protein